MVAEFMEFEAPSEPQTGSANTLQIKHINMVLDLNNDLQDEIGIRREQFDSISKTCDDLYTRIGRVDVEMVKRSERNLKLAVIGITIGVLSVCANIATFLFL